MLHIKSDKGNPRRFIKEDEMFNFLRTTHDERWANLDVGRDRTRRLTRVTLKLILNGENTFQNRVRIVPSVFKD